MAVDDRRRELCNQIYTELESPCPADARASAINDGANGPETTMACVGSEPASVRSTACRHSTSPSARARQATLSEDGLFAESARLRVDASNRRNNRRGRSSGRSAARSRCHRSSSNPRNRWRSASRRGSGRNAGTVSSIRISREEVLPLPRQRERAGVRVWAHRSTSTRRLTSLDRATNLWSRRPLSHWIRLDRNRSRHSPLARYRTSTIPDRRSDWART